MEYAYLYQIHFQYNLILMLKTHPNFKSINNPEIKNAENLYERLSKIFENDVQENFIIQTTKNELIKYWKDDEDNIQFFRIIKENLEKIDRLYHFDYNEESNNGSSIVNNNIIFRIDWDKEQPPIYVELSYLIDFKSGQISGSILFSVHTNLYKKFLLDRIDRLKFIICKKLGNDDIDDYKCIADTMTEIEHKIKHLYFNDDNDNNKDNDIDYLLR